MKTINKLTLIIPVLLINIQVLVGQTKNNIIWQIGTNDGKNNEFALSPSDYNDFLKYDFGWEDRFFLIGYSDVKTDWPYVLPGPDDGWGGTGPTSGIRTHMLNILFSLSEKPAKGNWKLIIDILDTHDKNSPLFKVKINDKSWKYSLKKGSGEPALKGETTRSNRQTITIDADPDLIREGNNTIQLTILEGSWVIFDDIRLEGPQNTQLQQPNKKAYIRNVEPAEYEISNVQPLLVDVEHLSGEPELTVSLDNVVIFRQTLEEKRYIFEAPMPKVNTQKESQYTVAIDGEIVSKGKVTRNPQKKGSPADYVNTSLGTAHSRWMIAPGPWMPFSMVKLSPDNQNSGWQAGYEPSFESIGTFSHIHEWTMTGLGMMPVNGPLKTNIGDQSYTKKTSKDYRSGIDKSTEKAPLGYYKVKLTDYEITVELTATTRCGFHRYTYPKSTSSRVMIDLQIPTEYNYQILETEIRQVNDYKIEGFSKQQSKNVWSSDADQDYTVYFVIEFDQKIRKFGGWINQTLSENKPITGTNVEKAGCYVEFDTRTNQQVQSRSALSFVDIDGARKNLQQEISDPFGWNFDAAYQNQKNTWNELLGRLEISSNDAREKMRFYTNMYRSFCRNTFSDVDGRWVDASEQIRQFSDPDAVALGCDAFWNTFWNLNQIWNLAAPEWSGRWVKSQLGMYDANGWLAKGPAGMEYIPVMVGEHEIPLIVSAYQMGIRNYDAEKAFQATKKMQTTLPARVGNGFAGNRDLESYLKYHFVPADKGRFSNTLEYSFDDWTVGQFAKALGKDTEYRIFSDRGNWWKNAINKDNGYAHMRNHDGTWVPDFDPFKSGANHQYVEGNAWQLTYFVPQDVPALADYIGRQRFIDRLTWGFEASDPWRYNAPGDQYWDFPVVQGNQQSMHFAFLFNWVGEPWQTQKWSRSIIDRYYGYDLANAYLGDEDQGQMSAWFVMATLGLFQTDGGCRVDPIYEIASPLYEKVTIHLGEKFGRGKSFVIEAKNASRKNKYVQSATLNGKPLESFYFPASELLKGGSLTLEMGPEPDKSWGYSAQTDPRLDEVKQKAEALIQTGLNAGNGYAEVWIRDLNTFIEAACKVSDTQKIREALLTFFKFQGKDGNIVDGYVPRQDTHVNYDFIFSDLAPGLSAHKNTVETDQETSLIQAIYKYVQSTGDSSILQEKIDGKTVEQRMKAALQFLMKKRYDKKYGLLWGATTADWGDVQPEHEWGVLLDKSSHRSIDIYDNAMFVIAIKDYIDMVENEKEKTYWTGISKQISSNVRSHLWDTGRQKFRPHIYLEGSPFPSDFNEDEIYYHGGTAIAIEAGLLTRKEIGAAYKKMQENVKAAKAQTIGLTLYPVYPNGFFKNTGMSEYVYQNGGDWTWFGGRMVQQLINYGYEDEAYEALNPMLDRVIKNKGFFEWYTPQGEPKGSGEFRGSAGVLWKAINLLQQSKSVQTK